MKSNIRYNKPSNKSIAAGGRRSGKTGKLLSSIKPRIYKGFTIAGSGAGFHHVRFNGQDVASGLATLGDCHAIIDNLIERCPNLLAL